MPVLGELRVIVANKNAELADRDAEIALLKRMLAEANNQNMKSL